ncbi:response regulator [Psychrobium sp. nBUS_13]|uniref:hybrid sensor histidine kinase/response regulator n=1 Tax=Psychrobium sp. nBUS_13 TaxID=3395319 RepID=UPI003EC03438
MHQIVKKVAVFLTLFWCIQANAFFASTIDSRLDELDKLSWTNIPKALALAEDLKNQLSTSPNDHAQARLYNLIGYTSLLNRDYKNAYNHISLAKGYADKSGSLREQAESKRLLASLYVMTNMLHESLPIFLEALALHKEIESDKVFETLQGISLYYRSIGDFDKYLEYGNRLLNHPSAQSENQLRGLAEYTVGEALLKLGKYEQARIHINHTIRILEKVSSTWVSEGYVTLAEIEFATNNLSKALETVKQSKKIAEQDKYYLASLQAELLTADILQALDRQEEAITSLEAAIEQAVYHSDKATEQKANLALAQLYENSDQPQLALNFYKEYKKNTDDLAEKAQETQSSFYNAQLNLEHKEQQITQLEATQALQQLELSQKEKTEQLRDSILALLVIILISLIYYVVHAKRTKNQMKALAQEANLANKAKSNFLAKMSHEIRTPMNAIIGLSQLALNAKLSPKQRENISMVHASSQSLLTLLNDILDFSKIEAKKLELEHADFLVNNSIQRLLNVCSFSADEKQLKLNVRIENDVPTSLTGDALRLEQVLINLVNNAIKFTEQGDINIAVSLVKQHDNINTLKFSVTDEGIGIGEEQLQRLFKAFSQADVSVTRRYGGSGLGLTICKELVELMDGAISVESELGKGSTFSFTVDIATSKTLTAQLTNADLSNLNNLKILIVDDSKSSRTLLSESLIALGLECAQARSGIEALEQIKDAIDTKSPYDIVLMDWRMPGLDGLETIRIINQVVNEQLPKFILVSSFDKSDAVKLSRHLPIEDVLEKPVKPSQLTISLLTIVNGKQRQVVPMSPSPTSIIRRDFSKVKLLIAEDNKINQKVILGFLSDTNATVDIVSNGVEAVEKAKNNDYHIILMDVQMPEMDGLTATKLIREFDLNTPIMAMTAHSLPEDIEQSMAAGMNEHLTKPINANLLIETITKKISI